MNKLISIIIPTYNSGKTINRAIKSVINQKYKNWELVIIDSYSNDNTISIINSYKSKKIKIYYIKKIKGLAKARYLGIKKSKGNLIAFLDSDDEWSENKLISQYKFYQIMHAQFCCTEYSIVNINRDKKKIRQKINKFDFNYLLVNRPIALSTVMIDKKLASTMFKKYLKNQYAEDYLWWLVALQNVKYCYILRKNLSNIHLGEENRSIRFIKNYKSLYNIYKKDFNFNYLQILLIFIKLAFTTFNKNIFKFRSLFLKH